MKAFILSATFIITAQLLHSQQTPTRSDTIKLIANKWRAVQMSVGKNKMNIPPARKIWMQFNADGTTINTTGEQVFKQKWKYDSRSNAIVTDEKLTIIKLSSDSLVFSSNKQNMPMVMYFIKSK